MHTFLHRYELDTTAPTRKEAWRDFAVRMLVPISVGTARLYRGMHSPTDVAMGALNGLVCAFLAWNYLRRDVSGTTTGTAKERVGLSR